MMMHFILALLTPHFVPPPFTKGAITKYQGFLTSPFAKGGLRGILN
jgi:hypothetical protein